ncbi:unnamed protein product [Rhodiola kirilowii]
MRNRKNRVELRKRRSTNSELESRDRDEERAIKSFLHKVSWFTKVSKLNRFLLQRFNISISW